MSHRRTSTTSPSLRFLGLLKQPDEGGCGAHVEELELDERDVVWSSSSSSGGTATLSSSTSAASSPSPSPSASLRHQVSASSRHFPAAGGSSVGLSALLAADDDHAPEATAAIPAAARPGRPQPYHQSAPVAVPAWPKGRTTTTVELAFDDEDDGGGGGEPVVPPHEVAARRAAAAASVMEGAGRTLKGRDLRRVRNAVWRTTGFLDL